MGLGESLGELGSEEISKAAVYVGVNTSGVKTGLREVTGEVNKTGNAWGKAFKLASVGLAAFATAFIGFAIEGIKSANALNAAVARIGAQTGMTTKQMAELRSGIVEMSKVVPQGIDQIAASIENVAKSGYNVADSLRIQTAAAKVATATHTDLATVTNAVVTAMKGWNIEASKVDTVTDTLITTVGRSRIDFDSLSRIIATAAPIAKDAGVSFDDLNAAIIAVGRSGLPARRAASGVLTLIRSLTSPTAQKEMASLGLHIDATTIAHKGLLATLQEIQKAAGKNIDVVVRQKNGQVDYAKSLAATKKANSGRLAEMQAMTGGAAGLITADILLSNGAKDYTEAQDALAHKLGATNAEFDKVKAADIGIQLGLFKNVVLAAADDLGTQLLPNVAKFVGFLTENIPKALKAIGDLWNNYLKAPLEAMVGSFLTLAGTFGNVLFEWGSPSGSAGQGAIISFFEGLASIVGDVARDLGALFDILKAVIALPGARLVALAGGLVAGISAFKAITAGLSSKVLGALNFATGGVFKLTGSAGGKAADANTSQALNEAAAKQSESATKMADAAVKVADAGTEAAGKLSEAATALSESALRIKEAAGLGAEAGALGGEAALNVPEAIRNQTYVESTIEANKSTIAANERSNEASQQSVSASDATIKTDQTTDKTMGVTTEAMGTLDVAGKAHVDALAKMTTATDAATEATIKGEAERTAAVKEGQVEQVAAAREGAAGEAIVGEGMGLKQMAGNALGNLGGLIGGGISKSVVPALVAQLATEILKGPIGGLISGVPGFENAGERIKQDFFGGLFDLFTKSLNGADAAVGYADETTIGSAKIKTIHLAKLGIDHADIGDMQSTDPLTKGLADFKNKTAALDFNRHVGESTSDWYARLQETFSGDVLDSMNNAVNASVKDLLAPGTSLLTDNGKTVLTPTEDARVAAALRTITSQTLAIGMQGIADSLKAGTEDALAKAGLTAGQIAQLTPAQMAAIGNVMKADVDNQYGAITQFMADTVALSLQKVAKQPKPSKTSRRRGGGTTATTLEGLAAERGLVGAAIGHYLASVPEEVRAQVEIFADDAKGLDAKTKAALVKKFGADWLSSSSAAVAAIPDKLKDGKANPLAKALAAAFGVHWRSTIAGIGPLLLQSMGGADYTKFKTDLAASINKAVSSLTASDLDTVQKRSHPGAKHGAAVTYLTDVKATPAEVTAAKKAISKYLTSTAGAAVLAQAASDDPKTAAGAMKTLGDKLKKAMPDAAHREQFIGMLVALQKTGTMPTGGVTALMDTLATGVPIADVALQGFAVAIDGVTEAVHRFYASNPGLPGGTKDKNTNRKGGKAGGFIGTANSATTLTYGEAGQETAIVLRNAQQTSLRSLMGGLAGRRAMPGGLSSPGLGGGNGPGMTQQVYIDHLHANSANDEQSIMETMEFLAPAGV